MIFLLNAQSVFCAKFIDASSHLYKWVCASIHPSLHLSEMPSQKTQKSAYMNTDDHPKSYANVTAATNRPMPQLRGHIVGLLASFFGVLFLFLTNIRNENLGRNLSEMNTDW